MTLTMNIWPQDPWGRVLNGAVSAEQLPVNVVDMAETAADIAYQRFEHDLHSIYLSGEIARNQGREPEFIVILRQKTKTIGLDLFAAAAGLRLQRFHSEFGTCKFSVYSWEDLFPEDGRFSWPRFRLAVNSISIAGRDLKGLIAPQRLSVAASNSGIVGLSDKLNGFMRRLKAVASESRVHSTSRQFAKTCLGAAFSLVMADEQVYSEDPETMASFAGLTFVEHRQSLAALARLSRTGTLSSLEAQAVCADAMTWLPQVAETWLDQYNPERDDALRMV